jgi:uncharacterized protein (DUF1778 family)
MTAAQDFSQEKGQSMADDKMRSAGTETIETSLDQCSFVLDAERYAAFMDALDNPPPPNARLKKMFSGEPPWDYLA